MPCLEYRKHKTYMEGAEEIHIIIKGQTLKECKEIYDKIRYEGETKQ